MKNKTVKQNKPRKDIIDHHPRDSSSCFKNAGSIAVTWFSGKKTSEKNKYKHDNTKLYFLLYQKGAISSMPPHPF